MDYIHLSEEEIAIIAEAMIENNLGSIPTDKQVHIKECDVCNEEIIALVDILEMENSEVIEKSDNIEITAKNISNKTSTLYYIWMGIAASLLIGTVILLLLSEKTSSTSPRIADEKPFMEEIMEPQDSVIEEEIIVEAPIKKELEISIPDVKEDEMLAFITNEELEKLSERYTSSMRGNEVSVVSPNSIITNINEPIILKWINADNQYLIVEIYNNKAELINEKASKEDSYTIEPSLDEGLYYWKLINSDFDLVFCGKILVK